MMEMSITIRRADPSDARPAADLWLSAREAALGVIPAPVHSDDEVREWFAAHVVLHCELWLAEDELGRLVGIAVLDGRWLDQLYVEPTMTGRGTGTCLVELAKRERPDGLRLWTFASNARAQRFYERHGFVATERTDGRGNEERAPDILYVWSGRDATP
jgi:GNAT superfamily N-acetyltransferase